MKRILTCAIAAVLALGLLAGCCQEVKPNGTGGSQGNASGSDEPAKELDLNKAYQALLDMQTGDDELVMLEAGDDEQNAYYPGLSDITLKQRVFYMAPVSGFACEVLMVETENAADARTVKELFQKRIDDAAEDTIYPDTAELWQKNAQVQSQGNYVCMIVLPDGYTIPDNIFSLAE